MVRAIENEVASEGVEAQVLKLRASDKTKAATAIFEAEAVIVGSPTLNNGIFPTLSSFLKYITGLKPKDKLWAFFGSYGWGGGAVRGMTEIAKKAGFTVHEPGLEIKYVPDDADLQKCFELGKQIAAQVKSRPSFQYWMPSVKENLFGILIS